LISAVVLKTAYRNEKDADVRERIFLLVTRVRTDKEEEASSVAEKEFHRSRWWMGLQMAQEI
jgi:hypothetical protein